MTNGDPHAAKPAAQPAIGVRCQRQTGCLRDTVSDTTHRGRVGSNMFGENGFAQLLKAVVELAHGELLPTQQQIALAHPTQDMSNPEFPRQFKSAHHDRTPGTSL